MTGKLFPNLKKMTSIFSIAIVVITLLILILRLTVFSDGKKTGGTTAENSQVESSDSQTITDEALVFEYSISDTLTFRNFDSAVNPKIKSSSSNTALMQVKILRNDNKRSIYESGYLKPGMNQSTIKLQGEALEAGSYECTAEFIAINPHTLELITTFNETIIVIIEENLEDASTDSGSEEPSGSSS